MKHNSPSHQGSALGWFVEESSKPVLYLSGGEPVDEAPWRIQMRRVKERLVQRGSARGAVKAPRG